MAGGTAEYSDACGHAELSTEGRILRVWKNPLPARWNVRRSNDRCFAGGRRKAVAAAPVLRWFAMNFISKQARRMSILSPTAPSGLSAHRLMDVLVCCSTNW